MRLSTAVGLLVLVGLGLVVAHNYQGLSDCSPAAENRYNQPPPSTPRALIVATLDGRIHVVDVNSGDQLWSKPLGQGPLLESSLGDIDFHHNQLTFRLIPSLDGTLYRYNGKAVEPVPLSADKLLHNDYRLGDDVIISGGRESSSYGLDLLTGESRYECSARGCFPSGMDTTATTVGDEGNQSSAPSHNRHLLLVERQTQVVRAHSPRTGVENWNFKVGDFQVYLVNEHNNCRMNSEPTPPDHGEQSERFRIIVPDGSVSLVDSKVDQERWRRQFSAPIVGAWEFTGSKHLRQLDLFSMKTEDHEPNSMPTIYMGSHLGQNYVQHSLLYSKSIKAELMSSQNSVVTDLAAAFDDAEHLAIEWRPQPIDSNQVNPNQHPSGEISQTDSTAVALFPDVSANRLQRGLLLPVQFRTDRTPTDDENCGTEKSNSNRVMPVIVGEDFNETLSIDSMGMEQVIFVSLWYWWREILVISVLLAAAINIVWWHLKNKIEICTTARQQLQGRPNSKDENTIEDEVDKVPAEPMQRPLSLNIVAAAATTNGTNSSTLTGSSSGGTAGSCTDIATKPEFRSRYAVEFTHVKCLGHGGFGVVFEARHKLDQQSYAVKRIKIKHNGGEKVLREVVALARLDHPGIVRFYSTWMEHPPKSWQEDIDKELNLTKTDNELDSFAETATTTGTAFSLQTTDGKASQALRRRRHGTSMTPSFDDSLHAPTVCDDSDSYVCFEASQSQVKDNSLSVEANQELVVKTPSEKSINKFLSTKSNRGNLGAGDEEDQNDPDQSNAYFQAQDAYLYIQMQLCKKLTLKEWLQRNNNHSHRDTITILHLFRQIVEAVEYIHRNDLIHRDLKPSNILFALNGAVKIGDFGLVTTSVDEPTEFRTPIHGNNMLDSPPARHRRKKHSHTDNVGTCLYMSPEQIAGHSYSNKVDIFSLGVIYFELLTPFKTDMERVTSLKSVRDFVFPRNFEKDKQLEHSLLRELLAHNAEERPTAKEICHKLPTVDHEQEVRREQFWRRLRTFSETLNEADEADCSKEE